MTDMSAAGSSAGRTEPEAKRQKRSPSAHESRAASTHEGPPASASHTVSASLTGQDGTTEVAQTSTVAASSAATGSAVQPPNVHPSTAGAPRGADVASSPHAPASTTPAVPSTATPPRVPERFMPAPAWSALSRSAHPPLAPSRSIYDYERLNHIQEGTYGVVFRARPRDVTPPRAPSSAPLPGPTPGEVAVKKLKLDASHPSGFPITALREIQTLSLARSLPSVVRLHEVCVGKTLDQIFLVLQFMEHDLKSLISLMHRRGVAWRRSEVKCLMHQLVGGVRGLHAGWVVHRDLKSSNVLLDNRGRLCVADFGLARRFGDPIDGWMRVDHPRTYYASDKGTREGRGGMTDLVVTLWYRAPELLILHDTLERHPKTRNVPLYNEKIDMWSVGCIFAELLLTHQSGGGLFQGKNEPDQLRKIERVLGPPNATIWPDLPLWRGGSQPAPTPSTEALRAEERRIKARLEQAFHPTQLTEATLDLLFRLLHWDPKQRLSAEDALKHAYFSEAPKMAHPDSFGSFPSAAKGEEVAVDTPSAPNVHATKVKDQDVAKGTGAKAYQMEFDFTA